jgi:gamma-glutamyltranspeptidase/glutathione hydrolase
MLRHAQLEQHAPDTIAQLQRAGHFVKVGEAWSEGRLSACSRERNARGQLVLRAGANARGMQGYAVGR